MNTQSILFEEKNQLRRSLKERRAAISEQDRQNYSARIANRLYEIPELQSASIVFAYISYSSEVITHDILKRLLEDGKTVVVPKILSKEKMVSQQLESWDVLEPAELGILAPTRGDIIDDPVDVAITPGLGFTEAGHRIGFGAGYYDRWFAKHEVRLKVALALETQIVEQLPIEDTDIPVDIILTEKRMIKI